MFDRKYYDQIKSAGYEYSQSMCISFCQVDRIGSNCTLRVSSIKAHNNMDNFCPHDKLLYESWLIDDPIEILYKKYFKNENVDKECAKMCPLECNTEQFDLLLTRNELRNLSDSTNIILYFDSAGYLNYEESPSISVYNLISNIGGSIGLLLGMSLLSIFEVLEMVILSIYLIIRHKYKSFKL